MVLRPSRHPSWAWRDGRIPQPRSREGPRLESRGPRQQAQLLGPQRPSAATGGGLCICCSRLVAVQAETPSAGTICCVARGVVPTGPVDVPPEPPGVQSGPKGRDEGLAAPAPGCTRPPSPWGGAISPQMASLPSPLCPPLPGGSGGPIYAEIGRIFTRASNYPRETSHYIYIDKLSGAEPRLPASLSQLTSAAARRGGWNPSSLRRNRGGLGGDESGCRRPRFRGDYHINPE